jgi:hypothetical protein
MRAGGPEEARKLRVFKNKWFLRFARRQGIEDEALCEAVARAEKRLIDADLGGGVIKQRIARRSEGKSGGFRSIVLFRSGAKAFFVYGFPKSARDNIRADELKGFKELADEMLGYDDSALGKALKSGAIVEVQCDEQDV